MLSVRNVSAVMLVIQVLVCRSGIMACSVAGGRRRFVTGIFFSIAFYIKINVREC